MCNFVNMELRRLHFKSVELNDVRTIYESSFPEEERREWISVGHLLSLRDSRYNMNAVMQNGKVCGMISMWDMGDFIYVEHFAIAGRYRCLGLGSEVIKYVVEGHTVPVVVEVELPDADEQACRRINFYAGHGFVAKREYGYMQPPYAPGLPMVPLMLMVANDYGNVDLDHIVSVLHSVVYGMASQH